MDIPKEFQLLGSTWKVRKKKALQHGDDPCHGLTDRVKRVISIDAAAFKDEELLAHTALHELVHAIATAMAWPELDENESRVDMLAGLLYQAWKTQEGELK